MEKERFATLVNEGKSTREIAASLGISQTTVRHYLKKYSLKTEFAQRRENWKHTEIIYCFLCERIVKDRHRHCNSCRTKIRRVRTKKAAVHFLGGACVGCGEKDFVVLEFHHLRSKDFNLGEISNKSWDKVKKELKKCSLLCANCHRRKHSSKGDKKLLVEVENYKGRLLDF